MNELVDTHEAARILGVHRSSVARFVTEGQLIPARRVGNTRLFHLEDVEDLKTERRRNPPKPGPRRGSAA